MQGCRVYLTIDDNGNNTQTAQRLLLVSVKQVIAFIRRNLGKHRSRGSLHSFEIGESEKTHLRTVEVFRVLVPSCGDLYDSAAINFRCYFRENQRDWTKPYTIVGETCNQTSLRQLKCSSIYGSFFLVADAAQAVKQNSSHDRIRAPVT
jgi:hypothetical protein